MLAGERTLEEIAERVVKKKIEPQPRSGRQELSGEHRQPLRLDLSALCPAAAGLAAGRSRGESAGEGGGRGEARAGGNVGHRQACVEHQPARGAEPEPEIVGARRLADRPLENASPRRAP